MLVLPIILTLGSARVLWWQLACVHYSCHCNLWTCFSNSCSNIFSPRHALQNLNYLYFLV
uniref:Uncharacterized protein n=1 Tax=Arundo donax TaxID=35708 RepID=A0A0A9E2C3_ARUDO